MYKSPKGNFACLLSNHVAPPNHVHYRTWNDSCVEDIVNFVVSILSYNHFNKGL